MAEGIFKKIITEQNSLKNTEVISAGTNVYFKNGATFEAIKAAEELGADISNHIPTQISADIIDKANLVLTMTSGHKQRLLNMVPDATNKIFTLKEFAYDNNVEDLDILDPFGRTINEYRKCAKEIQELLIIVKNKIIQMYEKRDSK